jgi:hypothetical protein
MDFHIPDTLKKEHEQLHARLAEATREPAPIGDAAREVARLLHPHFLKEEEYALPPLGLLLPLTEGKGKVTPEMADVLPLTSRLKAELGAMLDEHRQIVGALENLRKAAGEAGRPDYAAFADALVLHARSEEQVFYPAAILVGDYVALRLGRDR